MQTLLHTAGRYQNIGDFNEPLYAGDSVYFVSGFSGSGAKFYNATITLTAI
jgi:membrane-bound inhibitor of C-type lysozyme